MKTNKDEQVRQTIIEAAKVVFQKWGLYKSTMEDIAKETGKAKSTLYYYFKNKEEIFEQVVRQELDEIIFNSLNSIQDLTSTREKLKKFITAMLNEVKNTISIYSLVKGEIGGNSKFIDSIHQQIYERVKKIIKEILDSGLSKKEFNFINESQADKASYVIYGILRGLMQFLFLDNDDPESIEIASRLISEGL